MQIGLQVYTTKQLFSYYRTHKNKAYTRFGRWDENPWIDYANLAE